MPDLFTPSDILSQYAEKDAVGCFDRFWSAYPRKIGKGAARKSYERALKKVSHEIIMHGLSQQLPDMQSKEKQFIPHASTWLNQERWEDEPEEPNSMAGGGGSNSNAGADQVDVAARAYRTPSKDLF